MSVFKMSILSNVRRCWLAMPSVAGFLEMFASVPYNREKKRKSSLHHPPCVHTSLFLVVHTTPVLHPSQFDQIYRYVEDWKGKLNLILLIFVKWYYCTTGNRIQIPLNSLVVFLFFTLSLNKLFHPQAL